MEELERELSHLKALLKPDVLYAPPQVLYYTPEEIPGFAALLERQKEFEPRLKAYLQRRFEARHVEEQHRQTQFLNQYRQWNRHIQSLEANDPKPPVVDTSLGPFGGGKSTTIATTNVTTLTQVSSTIQTSSTITSNGARREPILIGNAVSRASRRSVGGDAVRSEEEMNRVLLSLLEQERENPATRWMATLAITPPMLQATPKHLVEDCYVDRNGIRSAATFDKPVNVLPGASSMGMSESKSLLTPVHHSTVVSVLVQGSLKTIVWTKGEEKIFIDKFLAYPKNFRKIATFLPYKTTADCVAFYYRSKKRLRLKQLRKLAANEANIGRAKTLSASSSATTATGGAGKKVGGNSTIAGKAGKSTSSRKPGRPPKSGIPPPNIMPAVISKEQSSSVSSSMEEIESAELSSTAASSLMSLASLITPSDTTSTSYR